MGATSVAGTSYPSGEAEQDRVTRTPLKAGGELMCSERVGSSCSTSDTRRVNLVTNPVTKYVCGYLCPREIFFI
jgi:hypothetical protein